MDATTLAPAHHNNPPGPLDFGHETACDLSAWMAEHPVIQSEDDARDAKLLLDRAKAAAAEIEAERTSKVKPLNERIAEINAEYKAVHSTDAKKPGTFDRVINELRARLTDFLAREEARRIREAEEKRVKAQEAELRAREAEEAECQAIDNAKAGELGVDVTAMAVSADKSFNEFKRADREAARAEQATHVKIGGGFRRSVSLRTVEILVLDSYAKAIKAIGPNDKIREAILSAARDYRKQKGHLPSGVSSQTSRAI